MTRIAIDAPTAVRLVRERTVVADGHQLVAPQLLRSQALSAIYRDVRAGRLDEATARAELDRLTTLRVRLLGDRVSRAVAWQVATRLGWPDTAAAEYVAVAQLQADVLVTQDAELARQVEGLVPTAPFEVIAAP